ncbi:MAG: class I SAM-dependent methyltransferase [Hyphomicrobiaceae bacterium]|nr:class I SAM-dependent methyltransferase [Hyphomicrobiaceae bacterium]
MGLTRIGIASGAALLVLATGFRAEAQHGGGMHGPHRFQDPQRWSQEFDAAERDAWQKPDQVLGALKLAPDAVVADVGAGTGYFSVRLAKAVPKGVVYAVDIEEGMLAFIAERAKREGLANIRVVRGAADDANLPGGLDLVLIVDTYHHIDARTAYMRKLSVALKPGGRVAIVDFRPEAAIGAPRHMRLPVAVVDKEMRAAGFAQIESHDFLPHQYVLVFAKAP